MLSNLWTNLKYTGSGIKGLLSNRVYIDEKNKTIREASNVDNSESVVAYNKLMPISYAIQKISNDCARILIELEDDDGVVIENKDILKKYYDFLHNKYESNGVSALYQELIIQIVATLKLQNEFFLRLTYSKSKDIVIGVEFVPPSLCTERIGDDGYIDEFEVLTSQRKRNVSQTFKRIGKGLSNIYEFKQDSEGSLSGSIDIGINVYLIHYHSTNGINFFEKELFGLFLDTGLRGKSNIYLLERSLEAYNNAELACIELTKLSEIKRHTAVLITKNDKEKKTFYEKIDKEEHIKGMAIGENNGMSDSFKKAQNTFYYADKGIDATKDLAIYEKIKQDEFENIVQFFGIPKRMVSTSGSAYNNLAVAGEEYERNLLTIIGNITQFLTKTIATISTEFAKKEYKFDINKNSSFLIRKERREDLEIAKEFAPTNEIREDFFDKAPIDGGEEIVKPNTNKKELTPEEASRQKRKMPHTGERIVKKTT